jgi:hypothetical protein
MKHPLVLQVVVASFAIFAVVSTDVLAQTTGTVSPVLHPQNRPLNRTQRRRAVACRSVLPLLETWFFHSNAGSFSNGRRPRIRNLLKKKREAERDAIGSSGNRGRQTCDPAS